MTIVTADLNNPTHQAAILALLDMYSCDPMGENAPLPQFTRDNLIEGLKQQTHPLVLIAYSAQKPVGLLIAFQGFSTFKAKPLLNIHDIAVIPEERCQGIGRKLLLEAENIARSRSYSQISLEVRADNPTAQYLYKSEGFTDCDSPMWFWKKQL